MRALWLCVVFSASVWANFQSRVPYPPLVEKLKVSGGSESLILRLHKAAELAALETGKRYKFVLDESGQISVAPLPVDASNNEYVHPILAGGGAVRTAGAIRVERKDGKPSAVILDQDSKSYCPTLASLAEAVSALQKLGVEAKLIRREDHPPKCE